MTVLIVSEGIGADLVGGGAQLIMENLRSFLQGGGHRVIYLARRLSPDKPFHEVKDGAQIYRFWAPRLGSPLYFLYPLFSFFGAYLTYTRIRHLHQIDLIHYHFPFVGVGIERWGRKLPTRSVYTLHAPRSAEYRHYDQARIPLARSLVINLSRWIEKAFVRRVDALVVLSEYMKQVYREEFGLTTSNVSVIPGGVDTSVFCDALSTKQARMKLGLPLDRPILFTVRRLVERMGLGNLVTAMQEVVREHPQTLLLIGGEGHLYEVLAKQVEDLGLSKNVWLLGFVSGDRLPLYYQSCDFAVLPTQHLEGFGLVILEALACNKPILGTPVGAIPDILRDFNGRLIFASPAPQDMARLIIQALDDPRSLNLYQDYRKRVIERYPWELVNQKYVKLFESLTRRSDRSIENTLTAKASNLEVGCRAERAK